MGEFGKDGGSIEVGGKGVIDMKGLIKQNILYVECALMLVWDSSWL